MWCQLRQVALSAVVLAGLAAQAARAAEPVTHRQRRPGFGKPVARADRLGPRLLCRRGLAGRYRLRAVERRAGAANRRRLARHRHADRACRSVARRRHGRADRGGADRRPGAALRSRRQAGHHQHEGAQGQGHIARRAEGHHSHLCRAHAGAERRLPGRLRHGVRRRHDGARLGAARRRGRCRDSLAAVQLSGGGEGLQQPRPDGGLCEGPAVLRNRGQHGVGQRQQGDAGETAAGKKQEHRLVRG